MSPSRLEADMTVQWSTTPTPGSAAEWEQVSEIGPGSNETAAPGSPAFATPPLIDPFITVLVPVRNEARYIARTLEQLIGQDYAADRFEVLVMDGRSTDATRSIVGSIALDWPQVRVLDNPRQLSSSARNIGLREAKGDLIVVVDGHCQLKGQRYFRNLVAAFDRSGADCLGRPQPLDVTGATPLQRAIAVARSSRLGHHPDSFVYSSRERFVPAKSVAVAYRRSVFDVVGPFDDSFDACEDVELNHRIDRAGLRCFFVPELAVRYVPRSSFRALFHQLTRYGRGRIRLIRKHPDTFSAGSFIPAAWMAGLVTGPLACLAFPLLWRFYSGAIFFYLAIVLATSAAAGLRHRQLRLIRWLPPVFTTIHAGSGWGALCELLRPSRHLPSRNEFDSPSAQPGPAATAPSHQALPRTVHSPGSRHGGVPSRGDLES
jgi:succinoglycan biosynthesis protein ExoA